MKPLTVTGCFMVADYKIDPGDNTITGTSNAIHIEPKAMQVLYVLACHAGETVSREFLMQEVWDGRIVVEDALTRAISKLRQAFSDGDTKQLIQTVPKKGYRLKANVLWDLTTSVESSNIEPDFSAPTEETQTGNAAEQRSDPPAVDEKPHSKRTHRFVIGIGLLIFVSMVTLLYVAKPSQPSAPKKALNNVSIALLPLSNLTDEPQAGYLAEGIPEDISGILSRYKQVTVKSRYATYTYAKRGLPLSELARVLSVEYLLEGSVRSNEEQYRIVVRLIEAETEEVVWSSVFEDSSSELFAVQSEVAAGILQQILPDLEELQRPQTDSNNVDVVAYQHYLTGLYWLMHGKTSEWFYRAEAALLKAIEQDEQFAAAYGRLAYVYARHDYHDVHMDSEQALQKARQAIKRALELNPNEVNAHLATAILNTKVAAFDEAQVALERALSVQDNHPTALYLYSELALARNDFEEALAYAEQARDIDPLSPWINVNLAIVLHWQGNYAAALKALETAISVDNEYTWAYVWQAKVLQVQGNIEAAISSMETCLELDPASTINSAWLGMLYLEAGDIAKADEWFAHTATLYGDSDDARFWQSYTRFASSGDKTVVHSLLQRLTLLDTPLFSLLPILSQTTTSDADINSVIKTLMHKLQVKGKDTPWVNIHNYQSAKRLDYLSAELSGEYRAALKRQIEQLEARLPDELKSE